MTITTIIPTFRRSKLLKRTIQSVLAQSYRDIRVCIYDNSSGDETESVVADIAAHDPRVMYYCHKENIGAASNFLFGISQVETPFFALLSDDDYLLPECYAAAMQGFTDYPLAGFVATQVLVKDFDDRMLNENVLRPGYFTPPDGLFAMLTTGFPLWTGCVFRGELLEQVGTLDITTGLLTDLDFELRIATCHPFVVVKETGAVFSFHPDSVSRSQFSQLTTVWPGCEVMRKNVVSQPCLTPPAREQADKLVVAWIVGRLRHMALSALLRAKFDEMLSIAAVLREPYQQHGLARLIVTLVSINRAIPFVHSALVQINNGRNWLTRLRYDGFRQK